MFTPCNISDFCSL